MPSAATARGISRAPELRPDVIRALSLSEAPHRCPEYHLYVSGNISIPRKPSGVGSIFLSFDGRGAIRHDPANLENTMWAAGMISVTTMRTGNFVSLALFCPRGGYPCSRNRNMFYYASGNTYYEGTGSNVTVGCNHLRLRANTPPTATPWRPASESPRTPL
jgi:hypothetical protein